MNTTIIPLLLAAVLLPAACTAVATPTERVYSPTPPADKAPSVAELKALFYKLAPDDAGKELVVRYYEGEAEGQGKVTVNTQEYYDRIAAEGPMLGGGTLYVTYELATGKILSAKRSR